MAARRLLIVMLILLGISSAIAFIVPEPDRGDSPPEETASQNTTGATGDTAANGSTGATEATGKPSEVESATGNGAVRQLRIDLDKVNQDPIKLNPGSRVTVTVVSEKASEVEIGGLGLVGFTDRFAPAVFDVILPADPGRYPVGAPGEEPATLLVAKR